MELLWESTDPPVLVFRTQSGRAEEIAIKDFLRSGAVLHHWRQPLQVRRWLFMPNRAYLDVVDLYLRPDQLPVDLKSAEFLQVNGEVFQLFSRPIIPLKSAGQTSALELIRFQITRQTKFRSADLERLFRALVELLKV